MHRRYVQPPPNGLYEQITHTLILLALFAMGSFGCGGENNNNNNNAQNDCKTCPERCLKEGDVAGRCVACLKDEHCRTTNAPTRVCTDDKRCVCGSEKDCAAGESCDEGVCVSSCPANPPCKQGDRRCATSASDQYLECAQNDKGCWEWSTTAKTCPSGNKCSGQGACGLNCEAGTNACGTTCVDFKKDTKHCGGCNKVCKSGEVCVDGSCSITCKDNKTACSGQCVDTQDNDYHCGACGNQCPAKKTCSKGTCEPCTTTNIREICGNNKDDDCDGEIDEASECTFINVNGNIADYAVLPEGQIFVVAGTDKKDIKASCYKTDGSTLRGTFTAATIKGEAAAGVSVRKNTANKTFLLSWVEWAQKNTAPTQLFMQRFDASCQPIGDVIKWPYNNATNHYTHSITFDGQGNFAALFNDEKKQLRIVFYDKDGKKQTDLTVETGDTLKCPGGTYGVHVVMDPTGAGMVSCQKHSGDAVYYRRFSANHTFTDTGLQELPGSIKNSSWYKSHALGINDKGESVLYWQANNKKQNLATFFGKDGKATKSDVLITTFVGSGYDGFRYEHQELPLIGSDFILRSTPRQARDIPIWYRYTADGTLVSALRGAFQPWLLRTNGKQAYIVENRTIKPINFDSGIGLCGNQPCLCKPNSTRTCYNGGSSSNVRGTCKTGIQTCQADGLGWSTCKDEILPAPEICGNQKDDDCDGKADEDCDGSKDISVPGITDFTVSDKGDIAAIHWTQKALLGYCFAPDGKVKRSTFKISERSKRIVSPIIKMSRNGQYIVVMWRGTGPYTETNYRIYARLYKGDCTPITDTIELTNKQSREWYDAAIDNKGQFSLVYYNEDALLTWRRYDNTGTLTTPATALEKLDANNSRKKCVHMIHIAVSSSNGNGVVSCQNHSSNPIYYKRFDGTGKLLDDALVEVKDTKSNSSWYASHLLGVNDKGEFVIEWQSSYQKTFFAHFYAADGTLTKSLTVGTAMDQIFDAFRFANIDVELLGDDFVLRDGGNRTAAVTWYRYTPQGVKSTKATMDVKTYQRNSLRIRNGTSYIIDGKYIRVGTITFK